MVPTVKCLKLLWMEEGCILLMHHFGSHWIRTVAPFRDILAGVEVWFRLAGGKSNQCGAGSCHQGCVAACFEGREGARL